VSTTILAMGAICVSPELMRFLYTDKYLSSDFGLPVFILYIFVDILSVLNITLILSAAGKTRTILFASLVPFLIKLLLNILLFFFIGEIGPAISSLIISFGQGLLILGLGATVLKSNIFKMFDIKYFLKFALEIIFCVVGALWLRRILIGLQIHYMFVIMIVYGLFCMVLVLLNM
jgi:O-antigen/teichoic acid export membrane protein